MPPAARVGDMHVCPMVTPAVPPIPHVGGPALPPGAVTVLIGGMPAANVGTMCVCVGPPDVIVMGSTTGGLWASDDQGESWRCASARLPPVYAVRFLEG